MTKTTKVTAMNTRLSPSRCQLRIQHIDQHRGTDLPRRLRRRLLVDLQRRPVTPGLPGKVEQVSDAYVLKRLEGDSTGVEQRRQPGDRRDHVAQGAAKCCDDTRPGTARQACSHGEQDAGARRRHDYQRRQL
jgi:hypothetical protein